jgi:glutamate N-acetyltransferase/amino-acid N-acetyltransferase
VFGLANGASGVKVDAGSIDALERAVTEVCQDLAWMIAADAEGGTKVMRIRVRGAASDEDAEAAARAVGTSPLVKTAMYGRDANWGRIVAALGRCGVNFDPHAVVLEVAGVALFRDGLPLPVDEDAELKPALERREIPLDIVLGNGPGEYELLASDLTHDYVSVNADYRT